LNPAKVIIEANLQCVDLTSIVWKSGLVKICKRGVVYTSWWLGEKLQKGVYSIWLFNDRLIHLT
jgi:hypothetical protein